jgi:hypothetical protein
MPSSGADGDDAGFCTVPLRFHWGNFSRSRDETVSFQRMADDLQFERADYAAPRAMACSACKSAILTEYYAANGQVLCAKCAEGTRQFVAGPGMGVARFGMALVLGLGAMIAGAAVYAGTMIYAHSEWALISIGIGWLVGKAVRKGSRNRGGWRYQLLAALLTYTSICGAYAAVAWHEIGTPDAAQFATLAVMMYALPFLGGMHNVIGWLIIGFGVWQAWKMNAPLRLEITGPHAIGAGPQPAAPAASA